MFIKDLRKDFYDLLHDHRVLLLVGHDVDGVCACRILQHLFQCDQVLYTLVPVTGKESLEIAFKEHSEQIKRVVMINCGATLDVVSVLEPCEDVVFFIADCHRPLDVYNIYNERQVRLLLKEEEEEGSIPAFDDIFRDDDSDTEDLDRRVYDDRLVERRRQKRLWEENRLKVMFDYTQFSYYGASSATTFFDLAWKLSKDTNQLLWWAIVGMTEQYLHGRIERDRFVLDVGNIQGHVQRHNYRGNDENSLSVDCMKISFDKELQLSMYRHWTLFDSLKHTMFTACKFRLWTQKGQKKLYEFLAELGLPLVQCKQKFSSMDVQLRNNVRGWIEDVMEKYGLDRIVYGSFIAQYGFRHKYNAADLVYAVGALLESIDREKSPADKFLDALDCLSKSNTAVLEKGIENAKLQTTAIFRQVQSFLDMHCIISAGPYLYAVIQEGMPDTKYFNHPSCLTMLARFLLQAHCTVSRSKKARNLPLLLMSPSTEGEDVSIIVGIPPVSEDSQKNFFGKAFEQAAERTKSVVVQDYFDSSVARIHGEDRTNFFDALISLLS